MKKNHELRVRISQEELEKITKKAKGVGMKVPDFVRYVALKTNLRIVVEE